MVGAQFGGVLIRTRLERNRMDEDRFICHGKESGFHCSERLLRGLTRARHGLCFETSLLEVGWGGFWGEWTHLISPQLSQPLLIFSDADKWVEWTVLHIGNWGWEKLSPKFSLRVRIQTQVPMTLEPELWFWLCVGVRTAKWWSSIRSKYVSDEVRMQWQEFIIKFPPTRWSLSHPPVTVQVAEVPSLIHGRKVVHFFFFFSFFLL